MDSLLGEWNERVLSVLRSATLSVPDGPVPDLGGRTHRHTVHLKPLIDDLQQVLSPGAGGEVVKTPVEETVWSALAELRDPEIPVLTLVEMKIIREVRMDGGTAHVVISPTLWLSGPRADEV